MPGSRLSLARLQCPAVFISQGGDPPFFCVRNMEQRDRPHMSENHILLDRVQIKKLHRMSVGAFWMGHTVEAVACFSGVGMPVIEKHIVEHAAPCGRACVKLEEPAQHIVVVGHMEAVLITARMPVVGVQLHAQHDRVICDVADTFVEILAPVPAQIFPVQGF